MDYFVSFKSLFMFDEIDSGNAKSAGGGTVPPKNLVSLLKESKIKFSSKFLKSEMTHDI